MAVMKRYRGSIGYVVEDVLPNDGYLLTIFVPDNDPTDDACFPTIDGAITAGGVFVQYLTAFTNVCTDKLNALLRATRSRLKREPVPVAFAQMKSAENALFIIAHDGNWTQEFTKEADFPHLGDLRLIPSNGKKIKQSNVNVNWLQFGDFVVQKKNSSTGFRSTVESSIDLQTGMMHFDLEAGQSFFKSFTPSQPFVAAFAYSGRGSKTIKSRTIEVSVFDIYAIGQHTFTLSAELDLYPHLELAYNRKTLAEIYRTRARFQFRPNKLRKSVLKFMNTDTLGYQLETEVGLGNQFLQFHPSPILVLHQPANPLKDFKVIRWKTGLVPVGDYPVLAIADGKKRDRRIKLGPSNTEILEIHELGQNPVISFHFGIDTPSVNSKGRSGTGNFLRRSLIPFAEQAEKEQPSQPSLPLVIQDLKDGDALSSQFVGVWAGFSEINFHGGARPFIEPLQTVSSGLARGPVYSAQPDGLVRFSINSKNAVQGVALGYEREIVTSQNLVSIPFTFLRGIPDEPMGPMTKRSDLELELAKHRFDLRDNEGDAPLLGGNAVVPAVYTGEEIVDVTPQGFEVQVKDGLRKYTLAKTNKESKDLSFEANVSFLGLQGIFQQNEFLMVLPTTCVVNERGESIAGVELITKVQLGDWGFELDITNTPNPACSVESEPENNRSVIVLKYRKGTVEDLLKQPHLWNNKKYLTSDWIARAKEAAELWIQKIKKRKDDRAFDVIRCVISNPEWTGVLLINPVIDLNALPTSLQGLVAGINLKLFRGHHLGFTQNKIQSTQDKGPRIEKSSLFGLISYEDNKDFVRVDENGTKNAFDFKVQELQVLFSNSEVKDFACVLKVRTPNFFKEDLEKVEGGLYLPQTEGDDTNDDIVFGILGRYVAFIGSDGKKVGRYSFIYNEGINLLHKKSEIFKKITIDRIELRTTESRNVPVGDGEQASEKKEIKTELVTDTTIEFKEGIGGDVLNDVFGFKALGLNGVSIPFSVLVKRIGKTWEIADWGPVAKLVFNGISLETDPNRRRDDSLFKMFPIKFRAFRFFDSGKLLGDLDFMTLWPREENSPPARFEYGLEWDVDFGSLLKLLGFDANLKGSLLAGWLPNVPHPNGFAVGIRFDDMGGKRLDLSLGSALKIQAGYFDIFNTKINGDSQSYLVASKLVITIFGKKLPPGEADKFGLLLAPNEAEPLNGPLGWLTTLHTSELAFIEDFTLTLGQRMQYIGQDADSPSKIIEKLKQLMHFKLCGSLKDPNQRFQKSNEYRKKLTKTLKYNEENEWLIGFAGSAASEALKGYAVYNPPSLYGGEVGIKDLFDISILYQQETPQIGVYTGTLTLAENLQTIDFGAVRIQLPRIIVKIDTEGGYAIIIGLNPDNPDDFSNAAGAEIGIFKGDGGFMYANINGAAIKDIPCFGNTSYPAAVGTPMFSPVTKIVIAARGGIGKTFELFILTASASITIYGILSGIWGKLNSKGFCVSNNEAALKAYRDAGGPDKFYQYWGEVGVIAEVVGIVDFGITRQRLSARLLVGLGLIFETGRDTLAYVRGELRITLDWVIARIRIFRKTIQIKIRLSFSVEYRQDFVLEKGNEALETWFQKDKSRLLDVGVTSFRTGPLTILGTDWTRTPANLPAGEKIDLTLLVTAELVLDDERVPHLIPMAFLPYGIDEGTGLQDTGAWTHILNLILDWSLVVFYPKVPGDAETISLVMLRNMIREILEKITDPAWRQSRDSWATCSAWGVLKGRFNISLVNELDGGVSGGTFFNLRQGFCAEILRDDNSSDTVQLGGKPVPDKYLDVLDKFFDKLRVETAERRGKSGPPFPMPTEFNNANLDDFLFEEYIESILRAVWARIGQKLDSGEWGECPTDTVEVSQLRDQLRSDAEKISGMINRQVFSGARVPLDVKLTHERSAALFDFANLGLDVSSWPGDAATVKELVLTNAALGASVTFDDIDTSAITKISRLKPVLGQVKIEQREPFECVRGESHALTEQVPLQSGSNSLDVVLGVPEALMAKSYDMRYRQPDREDLGVVVERFAVEEYDLSSARRPVAFDSLVMLGLSVTQLIEKSDTFELQPMNEGDRRILDDFLAAEIDIDDIDINFFVADTGDGGVIERYDPANINPTKSFLGRVNVSDDPNPTNIGTKRASSSVDTDPPVYARPVKAEYASFIELLRLAGDTNSGGYVLHLDGWPGGDATRIWLVIKLKKQSDPSILKSYVNKILVADNPITEQIGTVAGMVMRETKDTVVPTGEPGVFMAEVTRPNPNTLYRNPNGPSDGPRNFERDAAIRAMEIKDGVGDDTYALLEKAGTLPEETLDDAGGQEVDVSKRFNLLQMEVVFNDAFRKLAQANDLPTGPGTESQGKYDDYKYTWSIPALRFVEPVKSLNNDLFEDENEVKTQPFMYAAMGRSMKIKATFRDVLGFNLKQDLDWSTTLKGQYFDPLVSLMELTGLRVSYTIDKATKSLKVGIRFEPGAIVSEDKENKTFRVQSGPVTDGGVDHVERVRSIRADYDRAMQQLRDKNTTYKVGCSLGFAESCSFEKELEPEERLTIYKGLKKCVKVIDDIIKGGGDPFDLAGLTLNLKGTVPTTGVEKFFVQWRVNRDPNKVWPKIVELNSSKVVSLSADIPIYADASTNDAAALMNLAKDIEDAFQGIKMALTRDGRHKDVLYTVSEKLVTLRPTRRGEQPAFGATAPVSNVPYIKKSALTWDWAQQLRRPPTGPPDSKTWVAKEIANFDQELALEEYLQDVDLALGTVKASNMWSASPEEQMRVNCLITVKNMIAEALPTRVISILDNVKDQQLIKKSQRVIKSNFANSLKKRLSRAFNVDTLLVIPVEYDKIDAAGSYVLYGSVATPKGKSSDPDGVNPQFMPTALPREGTSNTLVLQFDGREPRTRKETYEFDIAYRVEYVRWDIDGDDTPFGVRWLRLVNPIDVPLNVNCFGASVLTVVPVLFKRLLNKPDLAVAPPEQGHLTGNESLSSAIQKARRWGYKFDIERTGAALQDDVIIELEFNVRPQDISPLDVTMSDREVGEVLFEYTITRSKLDVPACRSVWYDALAYWGEYLAKGLTMTDKSAFGQLTESPDWVRHSLAIFEERVSVFGQPDKIEVQLRKRPGWSIGNFKYGIEAIQPDPDKGDVESDSKMVTNSNVLDRNVLDSIVVDLADAGEGSVGYYAGRRVTAGGLDIFEFENAWPLVTVRRNKTLGIHKNIDDRFVYRTEEVRTGEPFTPFLDVTVPINLPAKKLEDALKDFFPLLLACINKPEDFPVIDMIWGYESGALDFMKVNDDGLRVFKHDPIGLFTARRPTTKGFPDAVKSIISSIKKWDNLNGVRPSWGRFVFQVRVYSRLHTVEKTLLRLNDVRFNLPEPAVPSNRPPKAAKARVAKQPAKNAKA